MCKRLPFCCLLFMLLSTLVPQVLAAQQWLNYTLTPRKDTINRLDLQKMKQGPWVLRYETIRGEPGFEEEGFFVDDKKDGPWRRFSLMGDLIARENYKWGFRDGKQQYFTSMGDLLREEGWKATNPQNPYDTLVVPDIEHPDRMIEKVIKHEAAEVKNGTWTFYDPSSGDVTKTEHFVFGQVDRSKDKAVKGAGLGIDSQQPQQPKKDSIVIPPKKTLPAAVQQQP